MMRQQAAEVLAAHRSRRLRSAGERGPSLATDAIPEDVAAPSRSQRIASRVTERYAGTQSYRAFLAAEAEEATRKARASAEVAARTAQAVAEAQQQLLRELDFAAVNPMQAHGTREAVAEQMQITEWPTPDFAEPAFVPAEEPAVSTSPISRAGLTVRMLEDRGPVARSAPSDTRSSADDSFVAVEAEEAEALEEEISFRQSPSFDLERASVPIPANLLQFPRQLVAARKARPRYAEGPLLEQGEQGHDAAQLRIFEVEASQITSQPPVESSTPEWSSIWLDALAGDAVEEAVQEPESMARPRPETASLERRVMACVVDGCLVGMGFLVFATCFAYNAAVLPSLAVALVWSFGALAGMLLLYMALFFSFSNATPGMRYARIGLCTFEDENPTRLAMLRRIPATMVAGVPLGLGFLWACLDDDRLGWHDRLSGMYQRSY